jgi:hypothetical protein
MGRPRTIEYLPVDTVIGRWRVISEEFTVGSGRATRLAVMCHCSCVQKTIRQVLLSNLVRRLSTNCGCVRSEKTAEFNKKVKPTELHASGAESGKWIGDDVQYFGLHSRVRRARGPASWYPCTHADETCRGLMEWANISHEYLPDVNDFMPLCSSHHRRYDS